MPVFDPDTLDRWRKLAIVDRDGATVGTVSEFYLDRETGEPTWALVSTGLFGTKHTFVPLLEATELRDGVQVPYEKAHIKDAPRIELDGQLTPEEEARLFSHYGLDYTSPATGRPGDPLAAEEAPGRSGQLPQDMPAPEDGDLSTSQPATTPAPSAYPISPGVPAGDVRSVPSGEPTLDAEQPRDPSVASQEPRHLKDPSVASLDERGSALPTPTPQEPGWFEEPGADAGRAVSRQEGGGATPAQRPEAEPEADDRAQAARRDEPSGLDRIRLRLERWVAGGRDDRSERTSQSDADRSETTR
jgi:sporulation protein YlmC with PRC-barrel domain